MAETTVGSQGSAPAPRRKRGWLRWLVIIFGVLVVLLVVAYFVGTSAAFLKGVILPKASASLNAKITVSDASISPFSEVVLKDLKVETTGAEPLVTAPEVRLRYHLLDIIKGNINVDEVTLNSPTVTLVQNPDGSSNLDPILKSQKQAEPKPAKPEPAKSSKPPQIDVKKIALNNATIRQISLGKDHKRDVVELSNVNLSLDNLKNGQTGKLGLAADIKLENTAPTPAQSGVLQAKLSGNFDLALSADLKPATIQGNTRLSVSRAEGSYAQAAALGVNLDCNISPTEIKQVALRLQKADTRLAELLVSGPFNMEKQEGKLAIQLLNVDKNVLNLAGASSGLDFGPTMISSSNQVELARAGAVVGIVGQFNLNQLQVTRTNQTTPQMDLRASYDLTLDRGASNVVIRVLNLVGIQKQNQFLKGELSSPMTINMGGAGNAVGDSAFNLTLTKFDLADWKAFVGDMAPSGDVSAKAQIVSKNAGKQITFDVGSEIANLTVIAGSNRLANAAITLQLRGQADDMAKFNVPQIHFEVTQQNQQLINISGSATYDKAATNADAQITTQIMLARVLQAFPQPTMSVSSGTAEVKTHIVQKQTDQTITGTFTLADFTGQAGSNIFRSFGTTADFDLAMNPQQVLIRKMTGKITEGQNVGGAFDVNGTYGLSNKAAQLTAKLVNFNQTGLHTFLEPMLGDKKLVSIALNANASVQFDPNAASAIKGDLSITNLVVNDPQGQIPATPLETRAVMDVAMNKNVIDLKQVMLALTPTARGTNQVNITGRVDMSQTNATQGNLKIAAESLDLTTYYDLFAGKPADTGKQTTTAAKTPQAPSPSGPSGQSQTPSTNSLPLRNFVTELAIGKFYLHEMEITNWQTSVKIDGGRIQVNPCKLVINGAPVNSTVDFDMGVPGYKYDVAINSSAIPLAPLVNSFKPEYKNIVSGTLTAQGKVSGVGTTGEALQKTLAGNYDLYSTNLNLSVDRLPSKGAVNRVVKTVVSAIAALPDIVNNPAVGAASLVQGALGLGGSSSGSGTNSAVGNQISKSVIDSIVAHGTLGNGKIVLQQSRIRGRTFMADLTGNIAIAPVVSNSTLNLPVTVYLDRSVAEKLKLAGNTPATDQYAKLPDYLTMKGTLAEPKKDINYKAFAGTLLQGLSGVAGKNAGALQGLGNALTGGGSSGTGTNSAASTNRSANPIGGLLQGVLGGGQQPRTNAPGSTTNAPAATNQNPVGNLLNDFLKPRKK